jgi:hypothetical protein
MPANDPAPSIVFRNCNPTICQSAVRNSLAVADTALFEVRAHVPTNHTSLFVTSGDRYQFSVPSTQRWIDFFIVSPPRGYQRSLIWPVQELFRNLKPLPAKNWFALASAIDEPGNAPVSIGEGKDPVRMPVGGELVLFANDAKGFYWNNVGSLLVAITRLE